MELHPPYIVVGLDGSTSSAQALRWAFLEGLRRDVMVRVVSVWNVDDRSIGAQLDPERARERSEQTQRDAVKEAVEEGVHPVIECRVIEGRPDEVLCAEAYEAQLLVLGAARIGRARERTGTVVQSALRHARCPVVVVPLPQEELGGRHRASRYRPRTWRRLVSFDRED